MFLIKQLYRYAISLALLESSEICIKSFNYLNVTKVESVMLVKTFKGWGGRGGLGGGGQISYTQYYQYKNKVSLIEENKSVPSKINLLMICFSLEFVSSNSRTINKFDIWVIWEYVRLYVCRAFFVINFG